MKVKNLRTAVAALILGSTISTYAIAQDNMKPTGVSAIDVIMEDQPIIRSILDDKDKRFTLVAKEDMGNGMYGYVFKSQEGKHSVLYKTPNNRVIFGDVMDLDGESMSTKIMQKHGVLNDLPATGLSESSELSELTADEALEKSLGFIQNPKPTPITHFVIFEPNCGFCKQLYNNLVATGNTTQIKWIPVSYLHASSTPKIEGALKSSDPLKEMFEKNNIAQLKPSEDTLDNLAFNEQLMSAFGLRAAPSVIVKRGEEFETSEGMPKASELKNYFSE